MYKGQSVWIIENLAFIFLSMKTSGSKIQCHAAKTISSSLPIQDSGSCLSFFFLICYAIAYKASNCEGEQGMAVFPLLLLLMHMQVILDDDSFAGETMNCMNQTFSQQLKTIAWQ